MHECSRSSLVAVPAKAFWMTPPRGAICWVSGGTPSTAAIWCQFLSFTFPWDDDIVSSVLVRTPALLEGPDKRNVHSQVPHCGSLWGLLTSLACPRQSVPWTCHVFHRYGIRGRAESCTDLHCLSPNGREEVCLCQNCFIRNSGVSIIFSLEWVYK